MRMSEKKSANLIPFRPGPDVRRGRGPRKGAPNAGRPPDAWRDALRALASRDAVLAHLDAVLTRGTADPMFFKALDYATEHGYGRASAAQPTGPVDAPLPISIQVQLIDPPTEPENS
jgi:hypothetical protein